MLPCRGCSFARGIPGDAHTRCAAFEATEPKKTTLSEALDAIIEMYKKAVGSPQQLAKWFAWPFNYDPVWGPEECPHHRTDYKGPMEEDKNITFAGLAIAVDGIGVKVNALERHKERLEEITGTRSENGKPRTSGSIEL